MDEMLEYLNKKIEENKRLGKDNYWQEGYNDCLHDVKEFVETKLNKGKTKNE